MKATWTKENGKWAVIVDSPDASGEVLRVFRRDGSFQKKTMGKIINQKYGKWVYEIATEAPRQQIRRPESIQSRSNGYHNDLPQWNGKHKCAACGHWVVIDIDGCPDCGEEY